MDEKHEEEAGQETGLRPHDEQILRAPFAVMAEALRANAEALRRIDANQRRIAESIEKGDKAQNVVASTRALNETFRGLSDIQRGLLNAVVKEGGRGKGLVFAFAAIAILAATLGFLLYERWTAGETVAVPLYEQARQREQELRAQLADVGAQATAGEREAAAARARLETLEREKAATDDRIRSLEADLKTNEARLQEYLAVKEIADRAGAIEMRNLQLERDTRDLRERLDRAEREREGLMKLMGERRLDERGPDPEKILEHARDTGVLPPPEPKADPAGPPKLTSADRRRLRRQLNHLLQQVPGEEAYEVLAFGGLKDGTTFTDVRVGRYRNAVLLNSLNCKELDVVVDVSGDTVELRFREGYIVNTAKPTDRIPFGADGHFVFLKGAGAKDWLDGAGATVGADGRLAWRSPALLK